MATQNAAAAVLRELESLGSAQTRKTYGRHGVTDPMYGVSYAHQEKLAKRLRPDTELARALWASGNHDARVLAAKVADPAQMKAAELDKMVRDLSDYVTTGAFAGLVIAGPHGQKKIAAWTRPASAKREWLATAGWHVVAGWAMAEGPQPDAQFLPWIARIEAEIHAAPNRVRYAMNNALIAIGTRSDGLQKKAVAAAKRIGRVEVDHGETSCKTPDATTYIGKARDHRRKKQAKAKPAAKAAAGRGATTKTTGKKPALRKQAAAGKTAASAKKKAPRKQAAAGKTAAAGKQKPVRKKAVAGRKK